MPGLGEAATRAGVLDTWRLKNVVFWLCSTLIVGVIRIHYPKMNYIHRESPNRLWGRDFTVCLRPAVVRPGARGMFGFGLRQTRRSASVLQEQSEQVALVWACLCWTILDISSRRKDFLPELYLPAVEL